MGNFVGNLLQSYGSSAGLRVHTVLPATRHRWKRPALTPTRIQFTCHGGMEGWVDLVDGYIPRWFTRQQMVTHPSINWVWHWVKAWFQKVKQLKHVYVRKQTWFFITVYGQTQMCLSCLWRTTQTASGAVSAVANVNKYGWMHMHSGARYMPVIDACLQEYVHNFLVKQLLWCIYNAFMQVS